MILEKQAAHLAEPVIERAEIVALLFNVADILNAVIKIELLLGGSDGEEEADES